MMEHSLDVRDRYKMRLHELLLPGGQYLHVRQA